MSILRFRSYSYLKGRLGTLIRKEETYTYMYLHKMIWQVQPTDLYDQTSDYSVQLAPAIIRWHFQIIRNFLVIKNTCYGKDDAKWSIAGLQKFVRHNCIKLPPTMHICDDHTLNEMHDNFLRFFWYTLDMLLMQFIMI